MSGVNALSADVRTLPVHDGNSRARAERLNLGCACESVGAQALASFHSGAPVFVSGSHLEQMYALIAAIHRVAMSKPFQDAVLAEAPPIATLRQRTQGVFTGYDFHLGADGPRLIEINTNAGGAMINAAAAWRHPDCCGDDASMRLPASRAQLESQFLAMFRDEWQRARGDRALRTIAIVDDRPEDQFLFPEFQLFEALFYSQGIAAFVVDAAELEFSDGQLRAGNRAIDLVYNRLTDFYFEDAAHAALRHAYRADAAVITPHPQAHALLADKRNLVRLSDAAFLRSVGASNDDSQLLLAGIPTTRHVVGDSEAWWKDRKGWFFKPAAGYASRGAYRGDKITRRAFGEMARGHYVAQRLVPPGERLRNVSGDLRRFKADLRHYVYEGETQLVAARLYQGQTTNFRTAGGGFAPVIELLDAEAAHSPVGA